MKRWRERAALVIWIATVLAAVCVILQTRFIADLSAFMPKAPTARQQMLVDQLRDGAIARLVLVGIEGGDAAERARLSHDLATRLSRSAIFAGVQNGNSQMLARDQRYFFDNRYVLSPAVTAERFTAPGLHNAIQTTLDEMSGDGGWLIKQILPRDPSGETLQLLDQFTGEAQPRTIDGVWASRDGRRAVLMVEIRASGLDTDAMALALDDIRHSFAELPDRSADTSLVMSGTSVLAVASRDTIQSEVTRLATLGLLLVVGLLLLIYRSVSLLLLGLVPVVTGALVGIASVSLAFGHVHGLTLGFGTTLIGEAVDYSIYLFVQGTGGVASRGFWRTIRLGVLTSITGFAALLCSSFPGLSQLGLYSISGLVAAVLVTRYVLPSLIPQKIGLRDLTFISRQLQTLLNGMMRLRWLAAIALLLAIGVLVYHQHAIWNRQLTALSPISHAQSELDASLRGDLSDNNLRYVASFVAPTQEAALQIAGRASVVLQHLVDQNIIGGFHSPSQLLPSLATQHVRIAALPPSKQLRANLETALQGLPIKMDTLSGFLADVEATRARPPLNRAALQGTSLSVLLDSMLIKRAADFLVLMPLRPTGEGPTGDAIDLDKVSSALKQNQLGQVTVLDVLAETTAIFDSYMHQVLVLSCLGCVAIALLLMFFCKPGRALRVILPLTCAVLSTTAILVACGEQLTLLHLVGLLLVVAVGSNYSLFFVNNKGNVNRNNVEVSVVIANLATVASFGLLGTSSVPVLSAIGATVGIGTFLALVFSAILSRTTAAGL